jgi:hypothetical protein
VTAPQSTAPSAAAIHNAGRTLALGRQLIASMTPRQQAEAAYTPTGPSVDELEARIREERGLPQREQLAS